MRTTPAQSYGTALLLGLGPAPDPSVARILRHPACSALCVEHLGGIFLVTAARLLMAENRLARAGATLGCSTGDSSADWKLHLALEQLQRDGRIRTDTRHDLLAILIGTSSQESRGTSAEVDLAGSVRLEGPDSSELPTISAGRLKKFADVRTGASVSIFGYPSSLHLPRMSQISYEVALLRCGVVAGKDSSTRTVFLDCMVEPGHAGSPVVERATQDDSLTPVGDVIGILTQFVPAVRIWRSAEFGNEGNRSSAIENSGYALVTPGDVILELLEGRS